MSGIWFGDVKAIRCSKAVIDECRELLRVVGCPPARAHRSSSIRTRVGVVQAPREETAGP